MTIGPMPQDSRIAEFLQTVSDLTTKSRNFFVKMYLADREENKDDIPLQVKTEIEELRRENRALHDKTCSRISSFRKSFANVFSHGKSEFDRE